MSGRLSLSQAFIFLLRRDLLLAYRNRAEYMMPLLFFVLVITMFPLALGALPELLARIAPGVEVSLEGEAAEQETTWSSLRRGLLLGLMGVFLLLSFQFRSYVEPLIVMLAIPLASIGGST